MQLASLLLIAVFLSPVQPAFETLSGVPISGSTDHGAAVAKTKAGQVRWKNTWVIEKTFLEGKPVLHFVEKGQGVHSPFTQEVRWTTESWWTNNGALLPLRSESTFTDSGGVVLSRESRSFDWSRKQARVERTDPKAKKTATQTLSIPSDTLSVDAIAFILQGLDFTRSKPFEAHLLTNEPKVYDVSLEIRGREKVQTSSGMVDGYKVELVPHLGILSPFRVFYPKSYFWFRADSTHAWLRYEGLENGPGTPEIVMEAMTDEQSKAAVNSLH